MKRKDLGKYADLRNGGNLPKNDTQLVTPIFVICWIIGVVSILFSAGVFQ